MVARVPTHASNGNLDTGFSEVLTSHGNKLTMCAWVMLAEDPTPGGTDFSGIMGIVKGGSQCRFLLDSTTSPDRLTFDAHSGQSRSQNLPNTSVEDEKWFVAVTNDVAANECKFYAGQTAASIVQIGSTQTAISISGGGGGGDANWRTMAIGRDTPTNASDSFRGAIDTHAYFTRALSLTDLRAIATCVGVLASDANCEFYYLVTGAAMEPDSSPNGRNATPSNTVVATPICAALGPAANIGQLQVLM